MAGNRPLVLTVDAQIDPLQRALAAGQGTVAQFGQSAADAVQQTAQAFASLATAPGAAARAMEQSFAQTVRNMQTAAQQAIKLGADYNPLGGMNSDASNKAAAQLEQLAQVERDRAAAASTAVAADQEQAAMLRVLATASTAAAESFTQQATSMRSQAATLALVEEEMAAAGTATRNASDANNAHANSTRALNLGQMEMAHVARAVADSYAAGIPVSRIAAMEIGRISEAMMFYAAQSQNTTGIMAKFAGVMGGPFGIALTLGIPIITTIVGHIMEMGNEVSDATKKLMDQAHATDVARIAQDAFDRTVLGSIEVEKKLTAELDKQLRTRRETNMVKVGEAQTDRDNAKAATAAAEKKVADLQKEVNARAGDRTNIIPGFAAGGSILPSQKSDVGEVAYQASVKALAKANAELAAARANEARAEANIRKAEVVFTADRNDALSAKDGATRLRLEAQRRQNERAYTSGSIDKPTFEAKDAQLAKALADLGTKALKPMSAAAESSLGDMVALLKKALPGVRITSTTGGVHAKNSDHYSGHAIDFVPAGGMGSISFDEMRKLLVESGVHIRRNASGTEQFFGPGHGPGGANDHSHDNHFHVAWSGKASPEAAERIAAGLERKSDESKKAYAEQSDELDKQILSYKAKHLDSLDEQKRAIDDEILAELAKKTDAIDAQAKQHGWTTAQTELLHYKESEVAQAALDANQRDYNSKLEARNAEQLKFLSDAQAKMLTMQLDLSTNLQERRKIARQLLELERKEEVAKINADSKLTPEQKAARVGAVNVEYAQKGKQQDRQYQDPMQAYAQKLKGDTDDMNTALKGVEADGLQNLSDGLLGVVNGTETVASAFKKMANAIISDIARIAVEKLILGFIGLADGGAVSAKKMAVGGMVDRPGGSRQDNVLTALSPGEFVVNASSTARHRRLIEAINRDDSMIPHFATGGMVGGANIAYPAIPSAAQLAPRTASNAQPIYFDLRNCITTPELFQQMNAISARHAQAVMLAAPQVTQANLQSSARQTIPT